MAALAPSSTAVRRALVVEDDGAIALLLRFLLERHGWQVSLAEDGLQAMQAIEQGEPPQLVLLDAMLPVHDGLARHRVGQPEATDMVSKYVTWGAGPRASQYLVLAAKARAALEGRFFVTAEDIATVAPPVLRHRIIPTFNAEAEGVKPEEIVRRAAMYAPGKKFFAPAPCGQISAHLLHWMHSPGSHTGIAAARLRFSQRAVPVGHVPSTGKALTGSRSP